MAARTSQAPLVGNDADGRWAERSGLEVGWRMVDLFDDGVPAVGGLGLQHRQGGVGEDRVVAVGGEQLTLHALPGLVGRGGYGVEALDPAHDQPSVDVVAAAS